MDVTEKEIPSSIQINYVTVNDKYSICLFHYRVLNSPCVRPLSDEGCRARVDGGLKNDTADGNGRLFVNGDFGLVFPPQMGGDQTCRDAPH